VHFRIGVGAAFVCVANWMSLADAQELRSPPRRTELAQAKSADLKAAKAAQPAITVILKSAEDLLSDLEFVFKHADEPASRFKTLSETLEAFLEGVDRTKPIGLQVFVEGTDFKNVAFFPVKTTDFKKFRENLAGLGIKSKAEPPPAGLYKLTGDFEGYLLELKENQVVIGSTKGDVVIVKSPLAPLPNRDGDVVVLIDNSVQSVDDRRKAMATLRSNTEKSLKKKETETDVGFSMRKAVAFHQLDELERFFVEAVKIGATWNLSAEDKNAVFDLDLTALADTSLSQSVELLGSADNLFGGIESKDTVASLTINFPIDDLRKKHLGEFVKVTRSWLESKLDASEKRSAAQKTSDKAAITAIGDAVDSNIAAGTLNGFVRIHPAKGNRFAAVAGLHVADPAKTMAALKAIAAREASGKVKFDVETEGDVKIHEFEIAELVKEAPEFLGSDGKIMIGTGPNTLWFATGDGAVERLKTAIQAATKEPASAAKATVVDLQLRLGPWIELLDNRRANEPETVVAAKPVPADGTKKSGSGFQKATQSSEEKQKAKRNELRKLAVATLKDCQDTLALKLERDGQTVKLRVQFDECLLKLFGKIAGKEVKENLE
jgi:hypothetical protein